MKTLALTVSAIASIGPAHAEFIGTCLLDVEGSSFIDGKCGITLRPDGSFQIRSLERDTGGVPIYFAYVNTFDAGKAAGYWNGEPFAGHAHTPLGELTQEGACWVNAHAKVCAWK